MSAGAASSARFEPARGRLQHARTLLLESRMPLAALALEVGFADASRFSRAFRNRLNETPGRIRQLHQGRS